METVAPRIDRLTPSQSGVVGTAGLSAVRIGFDEPVIVPNDAVTVWTVGGGTMTDFAAVYDTADMALVVTFAGPIHRDRLTVVVDFSITDIAGNELEGEIADPESSALPSGDGQRGGQAFFRFNVLP